MFVKHSVQLYGKTFCTYNTHTLIHLSEHAAKFASLENIGCFAFENFLGRLKTLLRKPSLPLSQVVRRYKEIGISNRCCPKKILDYEVSLPTAMAVFNITNFGMQTHSFFSRYYYKHGFFSINEANNCAVFENGDILKILMFSANNKNETICIGNPISVIESFAEYPTSSDIVLKYKVKLNEEIHVLREAQKIKYKGVFLTTEDNDLIVFAMLHSVEKIVL